MWYVIQTVTGKESTVKTMIEKGVPTDCYEECRIIYSETKRKYLGEWHLEKKVTFPGYLFVVTDSVDALYEHLKKLKILTKLLGSGKDIVPITGSEEAFLKKLAGDEETVAMSYGIQEGDRVIVTSGALKGLESLIKKVDRHKRKAFLEVEMLGSKRIVEFGLEILEKK